MEKDIKSGVGGNQGNQIEQIAVYNPPKDWEELNDGEKIERMKEVIKTLSSSLSRVQSDIHYLRENFKKHSHIEKEIVVPFNEYGNQTFSGTAKLSNPNFF
mgnify:FL=1